MSLKQAVNNEGVVGQKGSCSYSTRPLKWYSTNVERVGPGLFSEQYFEKPVVAGDHKMALSPTACTVKGVPVIDDF